MTYREIEVFRASELRKIKMVSVAALIIVFLMLFKVSLILGSLLFVVILIPGMAMTFDAKNSYYKDGKAKSKYNWDSEPILLFTSGFNVSPSKIILLCTIYTIIYFCFISMLYDYLNSLIFIVIVLLSVVGIVVIIKSAIGISKYTILVNNSGIDVNKIKYGYHEMKRHQFIKMKKGGYILEVNTGDVYFKFFVKDEEKNLIEKKFLKEHMGVQGR